jgi:hypothetical protein
MSDYGHDPLFGGYRAPRPHHPIPIWAGASKSRMLGRRLGHGPENAHGNRRFPRSMI